MAVNSSATELGRQVVSVIVNRVVQIVVLVLPVLHSTSGCEGTHRVRDSVARRKIMFDLSAIRDDGLRGPDDGLVAVSYEFCVPAAEKHYAEVRRIDTTVKISAGSRGRIRCTATQALCIGSTHQPNHRQVLERLAALSYVSEIRECFFE